jgi:hypothetical protein
MAAGQGGEAHQTRDRFSVALDLLNEEGEQNLSAVDIATALETGQGISITVSRQDRDRGGAVFGACRRCRRS